MFLIRVHLCWGVEKCYAPSDAVTHPLYIVFSHKFFLKHDVTRFLTHAVWVIACQGGRSFKIQQMNASMFPSYLYSAYFPCGVLVPGPLECADISHTKDFSGVASDTPDAVSFSQPPIPHRLQTVNGPDGLHHPSLASFTLNQLSWECLCWE